MVVSYYKKNKKYSFTSYLIIALEYSSSSSIIILKCIITYDVSFLYG